jgi:hypothetical protein
MLLLVRMLGDGRGVGGDVNDRHRMGLANALGRFNAIHSASKPHIHQNQVGLCLDRLLHGDFSGGSVTDDGVSQSTEFAFQVLDDEEFILSYKNLSHAA